MEIHASGHGVSATARKDPVTGKILLKGQLSAFPAQPQTIDWIAAAPVTRGISFSGSGQPYPNRYIAMDGTPNKGSLKSQDGRFTIELAGIPAGYYSGLGGVYVPPTVELYATAQGRTEKALLSLGETAAPFRWVGGAPPTMLPTENTATSTGRAMYYGGREDIPLFANQEAALRARAYPGDMTARGWPEADDAAPWSHLPAPA